MSRAKLAVVAVAMVISILAGVGASTGHASADEAFLCPVVGDGVMIADGHNGDNGVAVINPPVGTSFLPGNNQAGQNSNTTAHNSQGPGSTTAGPGHNPDFSPIWPAS